MGSREQKRHHPGRILRVGRFPAAWRLTSRRCRRVHLLLSQLKELPGFSWHSEPPEWGFGSEGLLIRPAAETDFWQRTHYGFSADNGHFFFTRLSGDFVLSATVRPHPRHQYDQAGLMVRHDAHCWIKTSVEHEPQGPNRLGAVVTNHGFSDWSTQDFPAHVTQTSFRIARSGSDFVVHFKSAGSGWSQLRVAHLDCDPHAALTVGPYACSPKGAGFKAVFTELSVQPTASEDPSQRAGG